MVVVVAKDRAESDHQELVNLLSTAGEVQGHA